MKPSFNQSDFRKIREGALLFTDNQADRFVIRAALLIPNP